MSWSIAIHGGAGLALKETLVFPEEQYHATLARALEAAAAVLRTGEFKLN